MANQFEFPDHPLCRAYAVVTFKVVVARVNQGGISCDTKLIYASGLLADGQRECVGVWAGGEDVDRWRAALLDLKLRGVERIRSICGDGPDAALPDFRSVYPAARLQTLGSPYRRRKSPLIEGMTLDLHRRVCRAVRQRGIFPDLHSATECVMSAAHRASRIGTDVESVPGSRSTKWMHKRAEPAVSEVSALSAPSLL